MVSGFRFIDWEHLIKMHMYVDSIINRSKKAGVTAITAVGTCHEPNEKTPESSQSDSDCIYSALGKYQWEVE